MQISPISVQINNNYLSKKIMPSQKSNISFCANNEDNLKKAQEDIEILQNSSDFQREIKQLEQDSLKNLQSYDDFAVASMPIINKYTKNFKIKEDFFKVKAKKRYKKIAEYFDDNNSKKNINNYVKYHYWWGITNKKFGSSYAFNVAMSVLSPFLKDYNKKLKIAQVESLVENGSFVETIVNEKKRIYDAKEAFCNIYTYLIGQSNGDNEICLPNSIMIECEDDDIAKNIANWSVESYSSGSICIQTNKDDSNSTIKNKLRSGLEKSQRIRKETSLPTLIYCKNFEKLLMQDNNQTEKSAIKALLSDVYEKYGATILFTTTDSSKFDNVLKQPHRITQIKV